jgi:hypothetical protein
MRSGLHVDQVICKYGYKHQLVVAMTCTSSVPRIALDVGIVGRGHTKIAERGHVPWLSLIVGMFTCTLCIIKGIENRKGCKQFAAQKLSVCSIHCVQFALSCFVRHC